MNKKEQIEYYRKWIKKIAKDETGLSSKRHIVHHAKEVYKKDPKQWSASMKNLIEIFDEIHKIKPDIKSRLDRLEEKFKKNKRRYTPPPRSYNI